MDLLFYDVDDMILTKSVSGFARNTVSVRAQTVVHAQLVIFHWQTEYSLPEERQQAVYFLC